MIEERPIAAANVTRVTSVKRKSMNRALNSESRVVSRMVTVASATLKITVYIARYYTQVHYIIITKRDPSKIVSLTSQILDTLMR